MHQLTYAVALSSIAVATIVVLDCKNRGEQNPEPYSAPITSPDSIRISDPVVLSNIAVSQSTDSAWIASMETYSDVSLCPANCFDHGFTYLMPATISRDRPHTFGLTYSSRRALVAPILKFRGTFSSFPALNYISLKVQVRDSTVRHMDGTAADTIVYYVGNYFNFLLTFQFDGRYLPAGVHPYTATISYVGPTATNTQTIRGHVVILEHDAAPFGTGWSPAGMQRLFTVGDSILITESDGSFSYFRDTTISTVHYKKAPRGDHSRVVVSGTDYYRIYRDGTRVKFNSSGRMVELRDLYGNATTYEYTGTRLDRIRDATGKPINLSYDGAGFLSSAVDSASGRALNSGFNASSQLDTIISVNDPVASQNSVLAFTYASATGYENLLNTTHDFLGNYISYAYTYTRKLDFLDLPAVPIADSTGNRQPRVRFGAPESYVVPNMANGQGRITNKALVVPPAYAYVTNPRVKHTLFYLDTFYAPYKIEDFYTGRTLFLDRDTMSRITRTQNYRGAEVHFQYDTLGNVTLRTESATGRVDTARYQTSTVDGIRVTVGPLDLRNNIRAPQITYTYTGVLPTQSMTFPDSAFTTLSMRSDGRPSSITDPGGHVQEFVYESGGRENLIGTRRGVSTSKPDTLGIVRDSIGQIRRLVSSSGDSLRYTRDKRGRITEVIELGTYTTSYLFDKLNLLEVEDELGQTYEFAYNALGWLTSLTDPRGNADSYQYDLNGNLAKWTNRRSQLTTYTYDDVDRLISRNANGSVSTFGYTNNDSILYGKNGASIDTFAYDLAGRMIRNSVVRANPDTTLYRLEATYDTASRRRQLQMTAPSGGPTLSWGYSFKTGLVDTVRAPSATPILIARTNEHLFGDFTFPTSPTTTIFREVDAASFTYPSSHFAARKTFVSNPTLDGHFGTLIRQDTLGRTVSAMKPAQDTARNYQYDGFRQLAYARKYRYTYSSPPASCDVDPNFGMTCPPGDSTLLRSLVYNWDAVGNPMNTGDVRETGNRMIQVVTELGPTDTMTYDNDGNMTRRKQRSGTLDQTFSWDALGQLTSVVTTGGGFTTNTATYSYDAFGRRTRKQVTRGSATSDTSFIWDGDNLLSEFKQRTTLEATYSYYPGTFTPLSMTRGSTPHYYVTDEANNVSGLLSSAGSAANLYRYYPFGYVDQTFSAVANAFKFHGQYEDEETGLIYMRNRYYDYRTRRFISEDPLGLAGGINPYVYADNDPINSTDPLGLQANDENCPDNTLGVSTCYRLPDLVVRTRARNFLNSTWAQLLGSISRAFGGSVGGFTFGGYNPLGGGAGSTNVGASGTANASLPQLTACASARLEGLGKVASDAFMLYSYLSGGRLAVQGAWQFARGKAISSGLLFMSTSKAVITGQSEIATGRAMLMLGAIGPLETAGIIDALGQHIAPVNFAHFWMEGGLDACK